MVHIIFCINNNYAVHTTACISSILSSTKRDLCIHIFSPDLSVENKEKIGEFVKEHKQNIDFIDFDSFVYDKFKEDIYRNYDNDLGHQSPATYLNLMFAKFLDEDIEKVICLDADTIVLSCIGELYDIDLEGYTLGACLEKISKNHLKEIGFLRRDKYFNSGVMLIDLKKYRLASKSLLREADSTKYSLFDQDILNIHFKDNFLVLERKFNQMVYFFSRPAIFTKIAIRYRRVLGIAKEGIIHYTGTKPWFGRCLHPYRDLYIKALRNSPFKDYEIKEDKKGKVLEFISFFYLGRKVLKFFNRI